MEAAGETDQTGVAEDARPPALKAKARIESSRHF